MQVKKGIFGHRRTRSQSEADFLCPLDAAPSTSSIASSLTNGTPPQWSSNGRSGTLDSRSNGSRDQRSAAAAASDAARSATLDSRKNSYEPRQVSQSL